MYARSLSFPWNDGERVMYSEFFFANFCYPTFRFIDRPQMHNPGPVFHDRPSQHSSFRRKKIRRINLSQKISPSFINSNHKLKKRKTKMSFLLRDMAKIRVDNRVSIGLAERLFRNIMQGASVSTNRQTEILRGTGSAWLQIKKCPALSGQSNAS